MILQKTLDKLEYGVVLSHIATFTHSAPARKKVLQLNPATSFSDADLSLETTKQVANLYRLDVHLDLSVDEIEEICMQARVYSTLSMGQLLKIKRQLSASRHVKKTLTADFENVDTSILQAKASLLYENRPLEDDIDFCILTEEEMNDKASPQLYTIRKNIKQINADIKQKLASYTRRGEGSKYLQDAIVTLRDDRYVIPVKTEYKNLVSGIIHDQSASGSTVYIEPMAIVQLNNKLRETLLQEKAEIHRILQEFTERVAPNANALLQNQQIITDFDVVFAKVYYADKIKATLPKLTQKGDIVLNSARHPLIDAKKVVPVSFSLKEDVGIVVITGPNTGGKTVTLKTVGLLTAMAMTGMYIPAKEGSKLRYFDDIFCDIGDEQSIAQNLSTFSSHIVNITSILEKCNENSLVLIDEVGAGTEPNEGSALALAITDYLLKSGAKCLITTHYGQLKEYSLTTVGVENASMEFNPETFEPTYKLIMGVPGSSNAIAIASRLGLQTEVIQSAKSSLSDEKVVFEKVLQNADNIRRQYEELKEKVIAEREELQEKLDNAKKLTQNLTLEREKLLRTSKNEAKRIVADATEQAKALLKEIKELSEGGYVEQKQIFDARNKIKQVQNLSYQEDDGEEVVFYGDKVDVAQLKVGDTVFSQKLGVQVQVKEIKNNKVGVSMGAITTYVAVDDLYTCLVETKKQKAVHKKTAKTEIKVRNQSTELNIIGQTVLDGLANVDAFIDGAVMSGLHMVWIVHGKGTGKLRKAVGAHLSKHPSVKEYRLGTYGEGEDGVTVVTLK